jgi:hypothetical protein
MRLSIIGKGHGWELAQADYAEGYEVWCVSTIFTKLQSTGVEPTKIFQLHRKELFESWIGQEQARVKLIRYDADFPQARRLPTEALVSMFGERFSSTVAWMLGLAIMNEYRDIRIHGVHMSHNSDYAKQRDNFFYLCGFAKGWGAKVSIDPDASIFSAPQTYGLI